MFVFVTVGSSRQAVLPRTPDEIAAGAAQLPRPPTSLPVSP